MDFRYFLVLIYFNTVGDIYTYSDLVDLLGLTYKQVDNIVSSIMTEGYLSYNENKVIVINDKGIKLLKSNGFYNVDIFSIYEDELINKDTFNNKKIDINDIYVPKRFTTKFSGYE
ncbi:hypothetical protein [Clostridium formicaceticum]|uniref:Uncharacterized protein n=1 Tax=Clostridium formicaceticum TaxID=1497 RepID=A0AAC9WH59_9CLOT|nr:hypothetical protein [Clostridium formicaceticum]AOY77881.1 hypothetical protein BJL90_19660 [Clostridium formicaceticum]ARE88499.1 hypothetical protein CLFO_29020 [Clostridium formicaceticum]